MTPRRAVKLIGVETSAFHADETFSRGQKWRIFSTAAFLLSPTENLHVKYVSLKSNAGVKLIPEGWKRTEPTGGGRRCPLEARLLLLLITDLISHTCT